MPEIPAPERAVPERILVLEDEAAMRRTLVRLLIGMGYECEAAASVLEARDLLAANSYDLLICDLRMPGESGMVLVEELDRADSRMAILMATAVDDPEIARVAAERGADGYLIKPFSRNELQINVEVALEQTRRRREQHDEASRSIEEERRRVKEVRAALLDPARVEDLVDQERAELLARLSEAVGQRDIETGEHIYRIGRLAGQLARCIGMDEEEARQIGLAAPMHDIGKVAIPDAILFKPEALSAGEREIMQRHARIGSEILSGSGSPLLDLAATIAASHHERYDGDGYPEGLSGQEIPLAGRIVAVVDVFDALVSDRPYRPAMSREQALAILTEGRDSHFDPEILDAFLAHLGVFEAIT